MAKPFFEQPILNSPYEVPRQHHALDGDGQPLDQGPVQGRRRSALITPVPKAKKQRGKGKQANLGLGDGAGLSSTEQAYNPTPIINEIRGHVASWRALPNPSDWASRPRHSGCFSTGPRPHTGTAPGRFSVKSRPSRPRSGLPRSLGGSANTCT